MSGKRKRSLSRRRSLAKKARMTSKNWSPKGMINDKNSCFSNVTLQALGTVDHFVDGLLTLKPEGLEGEMKTFFFTLRHIVRYLTSEVPMSTENFEKKLRTWNGRVVVNLGFAYDEQHDPAEFLLKVLEKLQEVATSCSGNPRPLKADFDVGFVVNAVDCMSCPWGKDPEVDLGVTLKVAVPRLPIGKSIGLPALLKSVFSPVLYHNCASGRQRTNGTASLLDDPPRVLVIQLVRVDETDGTKINTQVNIPKKLKVTDFFEGSPTDSKYELESVILHEGDGSGGHYTCLLHKKSRWFSANDDIVQEVGPSSVLQQTKSRENAYLVVYQQSLSA